MRHDGCRKPKLAEARLAMTSLRYLAKERLAIEPVGNVVKYFHIYGKHVQDGLEVALIEGIGELLC